MTHAINNIINNLRSLHDCNVCISDQTFSNYRQRDLIKYIDIDIDTLSINNLRYLFQCYPVCKVMLRMLLIIKSYNFYIESQLKQKKFKLQTIRKI